MHIVANGTLFLTQTIQAPPGAIIGPISAVLGAIINFIYNIVSNITPFGALGFSIIIMTVIVRTALLPSAFKMQRNMMKTREMKPEMDKIKEKYGNTKDPELRRKMQAEMQALQAKHGVNMLASCLPMLITWPLFMALFVLLGQAFLFIDAVGLSYMAISNELIALGDDFLRSVIQPVVVGWPMHIDIALNNAYDMNRVVHALSPGDWDYIFAQINLAAPERYDYIVALHGQKVAIQNFFGINLVAPSGLGWPGVILPVLSAGTMFLSQFLMQRTNPPQDDQSKMIQRITLIVFPIMFGFFTIQASAGVGLYWVALNIYLIIQHYFINKYYVKKDKMTAAKA